LFELRLKSGESMVRIFHCTLIGRRIVFLHQFLKNSGKTPRRHLEIARSRMTEVKHARRR